MPLTVSANKNWSDYEATSTTSLAITNNSLTALSLTISTGKAYTAGDDIALVPTAAKIPMMLIGTVTSYDAGTGALVANIVRVESGIPSWDLVSASSNTVGTGAKTFITYNSRSAQLAATDSIMVSRRGTNGGNRMVGTVTSYNSADGTLVTNITSTIGSGTSLTDWIIVSSGTFSAWNIVPSPAATYTVMTNAVFTIDKEPLYPVGSFVSLDRGRIVVNNSSTTTPWVFELSSRNVNNAKNLQLENNGRAEITGTRIQLATGTGLAGQTISLAGSPYTKIDFPAIEVETGSGTNVYRPWYVLEDGATDRGFLGKNWVSRGYKSNFDSSRSATVTLTTATPTVITWTGHNLRPGERVRFSTTGTFTGITAGVDYYVQLTSFTANTFTIATTPISAALIAVSAQTGTHTATVVPEFGNGICGNVLLWNPVTRVLRCGDGTVGNVIPSGAKVRTPNIYFTSEYPRSPILSAISSATAGNAVTFTVGNISNLYASTGLTFFINGEEFTGTFTGSVMTSTARAVNGTIAANHAQGDTYYPQISATASTVNHRSILDLLDGGIIQANCCAFGNTYAVINNSQDSTLTDVWLTGASNIGSTTGNLTINGLCCNQYPQADGTGHTITSTLGQLSLSSIYGISTAATSNISSIAVLVTSNQNLVLANNIEGFVTMRNGTSTPRSVDLSLNVYNSIPTVIRNIGARFYVSGSSRFEIDGVVLSTEANGVSSANVPLNGVNLVNCQFAILRNVTQFGAACRNQVFSTDANCSNIRILGVTYSGDNNSAAAIDARGNNILLANSSFGVLRDASTTSQGAWALTNSSTADTVTIRNCSMTIGDTYGIENGHGETARVLIEQTSGHSMWWRAAGNAFAGNYQEMGPFHTLLDNGTKATGTLFAQFSVKSTRDIYTLGGTAYLNNGGSVFLPASGDFIILRSFQPVRTVTGFTGTFSPEDVNDANLSFSFELVDAEANFANSFTTLTTANLNAALAAISGYSDFRGFKLQIRIVANVTDAANQVINMRMFTTNNAATVLPIDYVNYTLTGLASGSTVSAFNGSTEDFYQTGVSGTLVVKIPYAYNGTINNEAIKIRNLANSWDDHAASHTQYDFNRASLQATDNQVTVTNVATVSAYTNLDTPAKIYDYAKYWGTLRANLLQAQPCTKVGNALNFGSLNVIIDAAAAQVFTVSGGTATIKASAINGGSLVTTGTITLQNGAVTGTCALTGSNGASGILQLDGLSNATVYVKNNTGTQFSYQTGITGTYSVVIPFGSVGSWSAVSKVRGFRHAYSNFTPSTGGTFQFTPSMPQKTNPDGSAMYTGTTSAFCTVSFTGTTQANIDIGNGSVGLQAAFDQTEDALITNSGMAWLASGKSDASQFNSAGGDYLFLSTGWRLRRASSGDVNATLNAFAVSADGTIVDGTNGGVQFLASDSPTAIAAAVWAHVTRTLTSGGGATLAEIEGSTVLAKEATVASRASQTSVNAIPTAPLLAADSRLNNLDAAISSRSTYAGADTSGTTTLLSRVTGPVMLASSYTAPLDATATQAAAAAALVAYDAATGSDVAGVPTAPTVTQIRQEMDSNSVKLATIDSTTKTTLAVSA